MSKSLLTILVLLTCSPSLIRAQFTVRFVLREYTALKHDSVFITGTFSNWDSTPNPAYMLKPSGKNEKSIVLKLPAGPIEYKFTRGSWSSVEKLPTGFEVLNRHLVVDRDMVVQDSVLAWRDMLITDKKHALTYQASDSSRMAIMANLATVYGFWSEYYQPDSALHYISLGLNLLQKAKKEGTISDAAYIRQFVSLQEMAGNIFSALGNPIQSLKLHLENVKLSEKHPEKEATPRALLFVITDYRSMKDYRNVLTYAKLLHTILEKFPNEEEEFQHYRWWSNYTTALAFYHLQQTDSALIYALEANEGPARLQIPNALTFTLPLLGDIYARLDNVPLALSYYRSGMTEGIKVYAFHMISVCQRGIAELHRKAGQIDSALLYAREALASVQNQSFTVQSWGENTDSYIAEIAPLIASLYKDNNQLDSAYKYLQLSVALKDSLYSGDKIRQFQTLTLDETIRQQQMQQQVLEEKQALKNRVQLYSLLAGLFVALIVAVLLYRNNQQKQKANKLLGAQKATIEQSLSQLQTTQAQLVQSEKMASLGELTAGIAHEIQNPLNFVNNFSAVNRELISELKEEAQAGNIEEVLSLAETIEVNEQKIEHHGQRADSIVKGMLQHARAGTGEKEPTDINQLVDEYLRLAYQGIKAKDKAFDATIETNIDESAGDVNVVSQEIGRVLLNLFNNAFYAVNEKKKQLNGFFEPVVSVSTKKEGNNIVVTVRDNGIGMPPKVAEKVFQPFFTTKPTGEGTGLGLSLSYDIITKGHGGSISVISIEGETSEFTISLPAS